MTDARDALSVWDALKPKIEQLIADKTQTAVRQKKMNLTRIDTSAQTVTVYDGINSSRNITIPYVPGVGIEALSSGYSVLVQWRDNDISTAVAVSPGQGYEEQIVLPDPTITGSVNVSQATFLEMGDVLYTNPDPTQTMAAYTSLVSNLSVTARPYNLFFIECCYDTDYPSTRNGTITYIPYNPSATVSRYVNCCVPWYSDSGSMIASFRQIFISKSTSGDERYWGISAQPGYYLTGTSHSNQAKYCIPTQIIAMHI